MALTKIPRGLLDTGIADSSDATAITIDSSENITFAGVATFNSTATIDPADGVADDIYALTVRNNEATDGRNYGLWVRAGSTSADESFSVRNHDNSSMYLKVRGDGNIGIGTSSPGTLLHLYNSSNAQMTFQNSTTGTTVGSDGYDITLQGSDIYHILRDSGNQRFYTAGTERMRINSSGKVGIGTDFTGGNASSIMTAPLNVKLTSGSSAAAATFNLEHSNSSANIEQRLQFNIGDDGTADSYSNAGYVAFGKENVYVTDDTRDSYISFATATDAVQSEKMRIKSNGHVGINSNNPYSRFEVVGTSTAAYSQSSFLPYSQIGIKQPDNNGGYAGIRFTNTGGNYEGFIGFTQTTASPSTKADFVVQGYNRDATAYQEKFRITDGGEVSTPKNPLFVCSGSGGWTAISGVNYLDGNGFWTVDYDRGGNFTNSNGRFTAPMTGFYLFVFHSYTRANDTSGYVYPNFYVENSLWSKGGANTNIQHYVGHGDADKGTCQTAHIYLTANQYVRVGYSAHGNTGSISYHGASLGFTGHLIG